MSTGPKVYYNALKGRWEVVKSVSEKIAEFPVERQEKIRARADEIKTTEYQIIEDGQERVAIAPLQKGAARNDVDPLAGEDRFVLSNQRSFASPVAPVKVTADSVAGEIDGLSEEEKRLLKDLL